MLLGKRLWIGVLMILIAGNFTLSRADIIGLGMSYSVSVNAQSIESQFPLPCDQSLQSTTAPVGISCFGGLASATTSGAIGSSGGSIGSSVFLTEGSGSESATAILNFEVTTPTVIVARIGGSSTFDTSLVELLEGGTGGTPILEVGFSEFGAVEGAGPTLPENCIPGTMACFPNVNGPFFLFLVPNVEYTLESTSFTGTPDSDSSSLSFIVAPEPTSLALMLVPCAVVLGVARRWKLFV